MLHLEESGVKDEAENHHNIKKKEELNVLVAEAVCLVLSNNRKHKGLGANNPQADVKKEKEIEINCFENLSLSESEDE